MIEIKSRYSDAVIYRSQAAQSLREAVMEARDQQADLSEAYLSGANLSGADLSGANLSRANLSWANLSGADLSRANLSRANLSWADLSGANLSRAQISESRGTISASVSWSGHGECGRQLLAIADPGEGPDTYHCGCFRGTRDQLIEYIKTGKEKHRASRTLTLEVVDMLMSAARKEAGAA